LHGLKLVARNYTTRFGEIDLIMLDAQRGVLTFVEVRYRKHDEFGSPAATVTRAKQLRLIRTAKHFIKCTQSCRFMQMRFDVVSMSRPHYLPHIKWIRDAFQL
jgi:putative endonuclease